MINKILIAIEGSDSALNAAKYGIQLAKQVHAALELVYVVRYSAGNIDGGIFPAEIEAQEKKKAIQLINKIKGDYPDIKIQDFETKGQPGKEIVKVIQSWEADLLIIGHHTHHFLEGLLTSSIEKKLLKHPKIPVLIIPENYNF